ncbi:hypothetical protein ABAC460_05860 [Asticcacaulis sp. AC460]|uniref:CD225/dispanin family protein n=1 Tax=Asticcacaulis sp. AC460 TaxID=1282360 RepID=UPI0003C3EDDF|nr:CD225/dispanin family protein [Asticcacaulis sp. AC460]ESQ91508.1 hypothetical protein ABAC460_05860 [Asticcacaulis sp. AC460]
MSAFGTGGPTVSGGSGHPDIHNVPTYLVWSILSTLFCCLPLGIVAIVMSANVNNYKTRGDYKGAMQASNTAKNWVIGSVVAGIVCIVLYILLMMLGILAGAASGN